MHRGFAFVEYKNKMHALKAKKDLNDKKIRNKKLQVELAIAKNIYETFSKEKTKLPEEEK